MCFYAMNPPPKPEDLIPYTDCPHVHRTIDGIETAAWTGDGVIAFCGCCCHYMCGKCYSHHPKPENAPRRGEWGCHWDTRQFIFMVERFGDLSQREQGEIWKDPIKRAKFYHETPIR